MEHGGVEDDLLLLQFRLQLVLNLTGIDEQHLRNLLHLFFNKYKINLSSNVIL